MKKSLIALWVISLVAVGIIGFVIAKYNLLNLTTQKNEIDERITYKNEKIGIEFKYPNNFNLLDRTNESEEAILLSDKEISYSEFLDWYDTPIRIKAWTNADLEYINRFTGKNEQKMFFGNKEVRFITYKIPANEIHPAVDAIIIIFVEKPLFIEVVNNQATPVSFDFEKVIKEIASSIKFIR